MVLMQSTRIHKVGCQHNDGFLYEDTLVGVTLFMIMIPYIFMIYNYCTTGIREAYINDKVLQQVSNQLEVGKAEYDSYILNGLMTQLNRINPGDNLEESHMRNRQLVASWVYEKGKEANVIERITRNGKTYFKINDYDKLRTLFGELLKEIQRIKSEGDYTSGKNLVENFGVKVDQDLLKEVHKRYEALNIAPYMGFIQPKLVPVMQGDSIIDVKVEYNNDFLPQMLEYGKEFSFLPIKN